MGLQDTFKRPFDALGKALEERVRNPFISSFAISWILFNWKPIAFLIFSSLKIEEKIGYVQTNYADNKYLFIYPAVFACIYVVGLPFLGWGLDMLLKKTVSNRFKIMTENKTQNEVSKIKGEEKIALAKFDKEKAEADYKEQKNRNEVILDLEKQVANYQQLLEAERVRNDEQITLNSERYASDLKIKDERILYLQNEITREKVIYDEAKNRFAINVEQKDFSIDQLKNEVQNREDAIKLLEVKLSSANRVKELDNKEINRLNLENEKLKQNETSIKKDYTIAADKLHSSLTKKDKQIAVLLSLYQILKTKRFEMFKIDFEGGPIVLEYSFGNDKIFVDEKLATQYTSKEVAQFMDMYNHNRYIP